MNSFTELLACFGLNFVIALIIVRFIYYPRQRDKHFVFTFFAFNTVIFFVIGLLTDSNISIGVGFGMFGIFSILRYRTDTMPIREMTYLFTLIALPVLNSLLLKSAAYGEFAVVNGATIAVLFVLEQGWGFHYEARKTIVYERIELVRPENWPLLLEDLRMRTGLPIKRIEVGQMNFLRDTARITVFYDAAAVATGLVTFPVDPIAIGDDD